MWEQVRLQFIHSCLKNPWKIRETEKFLNFLVEMNKVYSVQSYKSNNYKAKAESNSVDFVSFLHLGQIINNEVEGEVGAGVCFVNLCKL